MVILNGFAYNMNIGVAVVSVFRYVSVNTCRCSGAVFQLILRSRKKQKWVTLISEMDLFLRNGRNGDFFTKWGYKILI